MANSLRYIQLENRLKSIETLYLPPIKSSGNYSKKEQDNLRAYLLLVHAEIESFFEEIAEEKAKKAFKNWKSNRTKSNILLSLVSFCSIEKNENSIECRVNKSLTTYINSLKKNNGIKDNNILNILLPIGYEFQNIDTTWLNTISSFGSSRGEVAHKASKVQQPLDPATLKSTVTYVLSEMKTIDENLKKIL